MDIAHINLLANSFIKSGIKYVFGVIGSGTSLRLITSLEKKGICYYPVAHEAAAALMAGACCRDGRIRAAAISIKGPGFVNLIPGILSNFYEGRPAVTVSEAYSNNDPAYCMHKRVDHYLLSSSIIKGYLGANGRIGTIQKLFSVAQEEFPGPVHIDLCDSDLKQIPISAHKNEAQHNDKKIEVLLERIRKSQRPMLVLGSVVLRKTPGFIWQNAHVPVATTVAAKGCINEHNSYAAGVITGEVKEISPENMVIGRADLIIAFGLRNTEVIKARQFSASLFIIDFVTGCVHDGFGAKECIKVTDLAKEAELLCAALARKQWGEDVVTRYHTAVKKELLSDSWSPATAFKCLEDIVPPTSVLVLDTGLFCTVAEVFWKASTVDNFCGSSNGRFMGTSIPTAIGTAISSALKPVVCVCGDGGVRPYFAELRVAVEFKLPVLFVFMSDGKYGTVAVSASKDAPLKAFVIHNSSWWRVAEATGCPSFMASNITQTERAIAQWKPANGPLFIEMRFDAQLYSEMTKRLR